MTDTSVLASLLATPLGGNQFIRKVSLLVYGTPPNPTGTGIAVPNSSASSASVSASSSGTPEIVVTPLPNQSGLDLSNLRIQFSVSAMDIDTPPTATIRVINLADSTATQIQKEFQQVVLQAGYENGNFGVIFQGTIVRLRKGRLSNIDTFVDIMASNLDAIYNFGFVNTSVAKPSPTAQMNAITSAVNSSPVAQGKAGALGQGMKVGALPSSFNSGGVLPRGKVMFGLARKYLKQVCDTQGAVWSIGPDGTINVHLLTGYLQGEAVQINAQTGLVGVPEATPQGIELKCLLNPNIKTGTLIQLNNSEIIQTQNNQGPLGFPAFGDYQFYPTLNNDGIYTAIVVEHEGDLRGEGADWLTSIIALNVDQSTSAGVPGY